MNARARIPALRQRPAQRTRRSAAERDDLELAGLIGVIAMVSSAAFVVTIIALLSGWRW